MGKFRAVVDSGSELIELSSVANRVGFNNVLVVRSQHATGSKTDVIIMTVVVAFRRRTTACCNVATIQPVNDVMHFITTFGSSNGERFVQAARESGLREKESTNINISLLIISCFVFHFSRGC